ncbi:hypothetical protein BKN38_08370 [Helicobacter sp. CLO-3]|nr:hypothetical protein BA723_03560 [Helicobacter sp. CLO-3]OHU81757.1 hypothetical protein BKN38_08370 [Helicobacter sp. CLO-3]
MRASLESAFAPGVGLEPFWQYRLCGVGCRLRQEAFIATKFSSIFSPPKLNRIQKNPRAKLSQKYSKIQKFLYFCVAF